ncbi:MAG: M23 family metallopeptidase, partial [Coriobacteriia bacterium]|nr:M23 family metallopeptidase [Coriobacteriia bacterium]
MHARKLFARTVFLSAVFTLTVAHAYAGDWSAPVAGRGIITPYGVMCPSGTHRGVDVAGAEGAEVHAPMAGTVVFSEQVPADCGGTCGAITIELDDGRKLSLLPFASMTVSAGDELSPGEPIGTLAAEGDDSAAEAHL